jgi:hypothetical protein
MAVKRVVPLNQINGVAAGATATINLPVGPRRYHQLMLGYKTATTGGATEANIAAEIKEIRMNIDGVTQRRFTPAELFNMNRIKGKTPTVSASTAIPGYLTIFLTEPERWVNAEREATCWGMNGVGSFQIEIDIDEDADSPVLSGFALIDDVLAVPAGIVKWKKEIIQVTATGEISYQLDTNRGDSYQSLTFIEDTAGDIDAIELKWDGVQLYKDDENFAPELLNTSDFTKVSKYRHVPLSWNSLPNLVPTIKDTKSGRMKVGEFLATLTMGAAHNVTLIREVVGVPD